jgi:hypothetical protein
VDKVLATGGVDEADEAGGEIGVGSEAASQASAVAAVESVEASPLGPRSTQPLTGAFLFPMTLFERWKIARRLTQKRSRC